MVRPMLLGYVDDLLEAEGGQYDYRQNCRNTDSKVDRT